MNYKVGLLQLVIRIFLLLVIYQLCRILFYYYNENLFSGAGIKEFLGGIRFDFASIFYSNSLIILLSTIPGNFKYTVKYQKFLKILFFTINILLLSTNIIDVEYFKFTGKRSTYSLITASGMEGDIMRLIPVFIKNYWYLIFGYIVFAIIFWKIIPVLKFKKEGKETGVKDFLLAIICLLFFSFLTVAFGRGGLQRAPMRTVDAINYTKSPQNTSVVLNTPFTIIRTISKKENLKKVKYFRDQKLQNIYTPYIQFNSEKGFNKKNLVVIILESFGKENIQQEFNNRKLTPFLDSLLTEGRFYDNAFANGLKSIDAVPSTVTSIPCLMDISYILSPYSFNKVEGFNNILKKQGYNTAFFHGAFNGSQNFNEFAKIAGFDKYYGKNEYIGEAAFDGTWGVFDEEFLQFMVKELSTFKQPFFSTVFTISSHNPYTIPDKYKNKFPKGDRVILESVAYTDYALKKFFESAKKQSWYKNTLFVFTADHTSRDSNKLPFYNNELGLYSIPIIFFDPENPSLKGVDDKLFSQIDILPEVLNYLNFNGEIFSFGNKPESKDRIVANYNEGIYRFIVNDYFLDFDGKNIRNVYKYKQDSLLQKPLKNYPKVELESKVKAYIQQFNNKVIDNKLFIP